MLCLDPKSLRHTSVLNVLWLLSMGPTVVQAQSRQVNNALQGLAPSPLASLHLGNYFLGIVIVFSILAFSSWYLRRYRTGRGRGPVRICSCLPLGGKERIMVIEVQQQHLLIGVSAAGINLLQVLDGSEQDGKSALLADNTTTNGRAGNWLQQTLKSAVDS